MPFIFLSELLINYLAVTIPDMSADHQSSFGIGYLKALRWAASQLNCL